MKRRDVIKSIGATALLASVMRGQTAHFTAHAADTSGYKALVCVFLFGGIDGHDIIIPADIGSYDQYTSIRSSLINQYGGNRARENLLGLGSLGSDITGSRQFGLPPEMPRLHSLYQTGDAAIIANVGPLIEPVTRLTIDNGAAKLPLRLFSHNDQQSTWLSGGVEGASFGWGGLFADAVMSANGLGAFTSISTGDGDLFLTGQNNRSFRITNSGASVIAQASNNTAEASKLNEFLRFQATTESNRLSRDVMSILRDSINNNATFSTAFDQAQSFESDFTDGNNGFVSQQLRAVARTIAARNTLQANRQIFFVFQGGHDTHSAQASGNPQRFSQLDRAIGEFSTVMDGLGLSDSVTLFTASDFGRTLSINGDGTDHGWGNHHFVVGGAVNGGRIFGDIPPPAVGTDFDVGAGRLIPQWSVEQMAGALGKWFGLAPDEIQRSLPNISRFDNQLTDLFL